MNTSSKKWYKSKTIWVNLIAALLGITPIIDIDFLRLIGVGEPTKYFAIVGAVTTVLNVVLRTITNQPIEINKNH
jgi:hypothetical protein